MTDHDDVMFAPPPQPARGTRVFAPDPETEVDGLTFFYLGRPPSVDWQPPEGAAVRELRRQIAPRDRCYTL